MAESIVKHKGPWNVLEDKLGTLEPAHPSLLSSRTYFHSNSMYMREMNSDHHPDPNFDCLVEILRRCPLSDLASASCVSTAWHAAALQVLQDADVDVRGMGSHRLNACTVMLARSLPFLDLPSPQGLEAGSYVDVHESHGWLAFIDSCGCVNVCERTGCSLTLVATIPNRTDYLYGKESEWKVFVLGATRNILTIRPNHCINVYVRGPHSEYRLKHSFWPACLEFQDSLTFYIAETDPQYLYVGCSAGKVLQLDVFNKGAVSRVYRSQADGDVTALTAVTLDEAPLLLAAAIDESHIPYITLHSEESSTVRCPFNTRYKTLLHLDVSTDAGCPMVLGTCENMLLVWRIVRDSTRMRLVYVTHRVISPNARSHSFLPRVCDEQGYLYACGLVESSVCVYRISNATIQHVHHVPVFGSNPMEHMKISMDSLTKILWYGHPAIFLTETAAGLVMLPTLRHKFSRPSSFLHLSFL